jgi:hypothetical protein
MYWGKELLFLNLSETGTCISSNEDVPPKPHRGKERRLSDLIVRAKTNTSASSSSELFTTRALFDGGLITL